MCGKNSLQGFGNQSSVGSPPRVREKPSALICCSRSTGITPACAGKTHNLGTLQSISWDHPRVCGKNVGLTVVNALNMGSPPRVREKPLLGFQGCHLPRITPACAGKTCLDSLDWFCFRDHPRVCGKNVTMFLGEIESTGSPPRVREKLALIY